MEIPAGRHRATFEDAWRFIVQVGRAAHGYGSTASRLESFLVGLSKKFGYEGVFRSSPSEIVFALRENSESLLIVETPVCSNEFIRSSKNTTEFDS